MKFSRYPRPLEIKRSEGLEKLDKAVEDSSEKNRNFFIAYLSLLVYVLVTVFSTTDLQLLISGEGLKLPIIDLNVSLVGFYFVAPIIVIALHFNFLQNLEAHHYKLMSWQAAHGRKVPRSYIHPFLFDFASLDRTSQFNSLIQTANSLLCYNLAPITLALMLIRYSDTQDALVFIWQCLAFWVDVTLVFFMRKALKDNEKLGLRPAIGSFSRRSGLQPVRFILDVVFRQFGWLVLLQIWIFILITANDDDLPPLVQRSANSGARLVEWLLPRISIESTAIVWEPDDKKLKSIAKLAGQDDWWKYFREHGKGFLPEPKSLQLLDLHEQNLMRAQLNGMRMQGANLRGTGLQGADLRQAQLQGAHLEEAQLQGADLRYAQLRGAHLEEAQLQGANLRQAQLQGVNLRQAQMQGADLRGSGLPSSHMEQAQLQNSHMEQVRLQGAKLSQAQLQGANLSQAQLQGASLKHAQLQGADLRGTQLQGIDLRGAGLQGADLRGKQLQGTDLRGTQLQGADLRGAQLQGADLGLAQLQGADLRGAQLQGANLGLAQLQGADLQGTDLQGCILYLTSFIGAKGISDSVVYGITGQEGLISGTKPDWEELEKLAITINNPDYRDNYLQRIKTAAANSSANEAGQHLWHAPKDIAKVALMEVCSETHIKPAKKLAAQAFRESYQQLSDKEISFNNPLESSEYRDLLKDINRTLCTLEACADIRNDIYGLNCDL